MIQCRVQSDKSTDQRLLTHYQPILYLLPLYIHPILVLPRFPSSEHSLISLRVQILVWIGELNQNNNRMPNVSCLLLTDVKNVISEKSKESFESSMNELNNW